MTCSFWLCRLVGHKGVPINKPYMPAEGTQALVCARTGQQVAAW